LIWTCTGKVRQQNSQKGIIYEFGNNKFEADQEIDSKMRLEDERIVGEEGWQEKVHNEEEWKKLLRTARNRRILHTPME